MRIAPAAGIVAAALLAAACGEGRTAPTQSPTGSQVATIAVSPDSLSIPYLGTNGEVQLAATALDAAGGVVNGVPITWSSTDTGVVVVSAGGLVTSREQGTARVVAAGGGRVGSAIVVVYFIPSDSTSAP